MRSSKTQNDLQLKVQLNFISHLRQSRSISAEQIVQADSQKTNFSLLFNETKSENFDEKIRKTWNLSASLLNSSRHFTFLLNSVVFSCRSVSLDWITRNLEQERNLSFSLRTKFVKFLIEIFFTERNWNVFQRSSTYCDVDNFSRRKTIPVGIILSVNMFNHAILLQYSLFSLIHVRTEFCFQEIRFSLFVSDKEK